jgi:4'-phosphopantetheinyl transferase
MVPISSLNAAEVHVWCADPAELDADDLQSAARSFITGGEARQLARFRFAQDRSTYLASRVLLRTVLSRYAPVPPAGWRFAIGPHGRPEIAGDQPALRFNLSHTHGLVVCAVSLQPSLGVDVEYTGGRAPLEIAEEFFAPGEASVLRAMPPDEQPRCFFEYWTLKESYVKARGLGLNLPLDRFTVTRGLKGEIKVVTEAALDPDADSWQFVQWWPTPDHVVAVCVKRPGRANVRIFLGWHSLAASFR